MEESMVVNKKKSSEGLDLPPGFRFHPTDEEIISYYLTPKVLDSSFTATAIGEADFNKCEPWDLPTNQWNADKAKYFFCQRDRKYPTGMRTNRATDSGYWKATGKDKEIFKGKGNLVGMKKTLVFYTGRAPKGQKTNWVMHEFRLQPNFASPNPAKDEWVVSRVFHKGNELKKNNSIPIQGVLRIANSFEHDFIHSSHSSLPPLMDPSYTNTPDDDFKANPPPPHPSSSIPLSDGYYLPNVINNHQQPRHQYYNNVSTINNNTQPNFSSFHHNDHNSMINNTTNTTYDDVVFGMLEKEKQYCKKEPLLFSCTTNTTANQSSVDTGVTSAVNDRNADTCSVVSKLVVHNNNNINNLYEDLHAPSSSVGIGPLSDFECLWSDY